MWVRIREVSFPKDSVDEVINQMRNTAVARFDGEGHRGFRLLVDRPNGKALEVSYWQTEAEARAEACVETAKLASVPGGSVERTNHYELSIDAA